jgi:hypothetical protein
MFMFGSAAMLVFFSQVAYVHPGGKWRGGISVLSLPLAFSLSCLAWRPQRRSNQLLLPLPPPPHSSQGQNLKKR